MSEAKRWPEECDLMAVTIKQVEYYGYVDAIDFDIRQPMLKIEFAPGHSQWFDMSECKFVEYPEEKP
jgi:hypothetical protein